VASPTDVLRNAYERVSGNLTASIINISDIASDIELACRKPFFDMEDGVIFSEHQK
jgi:hypothetical protein